MAVEARAAEAAEAAAAALALADEKAEAVCALPDCMLIASLISSRGREGGGGVRSRGGGGDPCLACTCSLRRLPSLQVCALEAAAASVRLAQAAWKVEVDTTEAQRTAHSTLSEQLTTLRARRTGRGRREGEEEEEEGGEDDDDEEDEPSDDGVAADEAALTEDSRLACKCSPRRPPFPTGVAMDEAALTEDGTLTAAVETVASLEAARLQLRAEEHHLLSMQRALDVVALEAYLSASAAEARLQSEAREASDLAEASSRRVEVNVTVTVNVNDELAPVSRCSAAPTSAPALHACAHHGALPSPQVLQRERSRRFLRGAHAIGDALRATFRSLCKHGDAALEYAYAPSILSHLHASAHHGAAPSPQVRGCSVDPLRRRGLDRRQAPARRVDAVRDTLGRTAGARSGGAHDGASGGHVP